MKKRVLALAAILLTTLTCWPIPSQGADIPNTQKPSYKQSCKNLANQIIDEFIKCDYNATILERAFEEWMQYASNYTKKNANEQYLEFENTIVELRKLLKAPSDITLTEGEMQALRSKGLQDDELLSQNTFHKKLYNEAHSVLNEFFILAKQFKPESVSNSDLSHSITKLTLEAAYYNMLRTFSMLSNALFDKDIKAKLAGLTFQYSVDTNLPTSKYESMIGATISKIGGIISILNRHADDEHKKLIKLRRYLDRHIRALKAKEEAAAELDEIYNTSVDSNDTKDMVADKIKRYTDIINRFETCANEYISSLIALEEFANSDMDSVNEERETLEKIIDSCNEVINQLKIAYENM